jgi:hypothetical protein
MARRRGNIWSTRQPAFGHLAERNTQLCDRCYDCWAEGIGGKEGREDAELHIARRRERDLDGPAGNSLPGMRRFRNWGVSTVFRGKKGVEIQRIWYWWWWDLI